jgi:hypothetical protein
LSGCVVQVGETVGEYKILMDDGKFEALEGDERRI